MQNHVKIWSGTRALSALFKLVHCVLPAVAEYKDLVVSQKNLLTYEDNKIPVGITYQKGDTDGNKNAESTSVHDCEDEEGVTSGPLQFVVHGLTGEQLQDMSADALKGAAMAHLKSRNPFVPSQDNTETKGKKQRSKTVKAPVLAIGRSKMPESLYENPTLYTRIFPWLFPYGLGGMGMSLGASDNIWKQTKMMYHDKQFQFESLFPLLLNNHEQIKQATTGGFLMTNRKNFHKVVDRVMNVDTETLLSLAKKMQEGERVKAETDEEKTCFDLINDLDHVSYSVNGSATSKKHMRNEIWATISYLGAPSWFITFVPADNKNPICFYMADNKIEFKPETKRDHNEIYRLIANNPVAGARFFHLAVELFLKHVLGVGSDHPGLFGKTESYYGTVEQQGRLTLHLHLLLWIANSLSPQQIRERLMGPDSKFKAEMIEYLESCHVGQFSTGSLDEVREKVNQDVQSDGYINPVESLPKRVPEQCAKECGQCDQCKENKAWWDALPDILDDIIFKSNIHTCNQKCTDNWNKACKARFPRTLFKETVIDNKTGTIDMKKLEEWINFYSPILSYLLRSNSDITSLLSGTAIKAIVIYITDYITKFPLKTAAMFDTIRGVFNKNQEYMNGDSSREEKSRKLITQVVNSLTSRLEIGSPMASLYLLGNPDHYTNYTFTVFYWQNYVSFVRKPHSIICEQNLHTNEDDPDDLDNQKVQLMKKGGTIYGYSKLDDYIYRPIIFSHICLYDWVRLHRKDRSRNKSEVNSALDVRDPSPSPDELDILGEDDNDNDRINKSNDDVEQQVERSQFEEEMQESDDELDVISEIVNLDKADNPKQTWHSFLDEHPQKLSHKVKIVADENGHIPNMIPSLPRCDKGDHSYYCCTMLTLFKPWRNGLDLKSVDQDWDIVFNNHVFNERQTQLMQYFNVKYECHDARDDFHQQRKSKEKGASLPSWYNDETVEHYDQEDYVETVLNQMDSQDDSDEIPEEYKLVSAQTAKKDRQVKEMSNILENSGWLDHSLDGTQFDPSLLQDNIGLNSVKHWADLLTNKKKDLLSQKLKSMHKMPKDKGHQFNDDFEENEVVISNEDHLKLNAKMSKKDKQIIKSISTKGTLNEEQDRAFNIVASHAVNPTATQLSMYLGGMAGTGKSQVIKSLITFFGIRDEDYRFMVLAPTGSAAALVHGSTYHSVLGIRETNGEQKTTRKTLNQIKDRLAGISYIFIDEVSMMSCQDMYHVSARLAVAKNNTHDPFGGVNMIFAGDFAQLPPAMNNAPLYSGNVRNRVDGSTTIKGQENAIGKALWHQVTTVVILKENMRQKTQTPEDAKLRTALENMRYRACTDEDILFLRSLIAGKSEGRKKLNQKRFRDVSVITGLNIHRDALNENGAERFASDTDQILETFYSIDQAVITDPSKNRNHKGRGRNVARAPIGSFEQNILWNLPPSLTEQHAGKLKLCKGMPVMIKRNEATECCVTNGAEGTVYDWNYTVMPNKKKVLTVLFLKLKNPPKNVKLEGLPENVVPLKRNGETIVCAMPNGKHIKVIREQISVLLNFGMSDYSSQGRTRPNNVIDLQNCKTHQSFYTALSRSASAEGTIIIQGFEQSKIQNAGNLSGHLRQEFRELELLNEITKLRYENKLPDSVNAKRRYALIQQFKTLKGLFL